MLSVPFNWDCRFMAGVKLNRAAFGPAVSKPRAFMNS